MPASLVDSIAQSMSSGLISRLSTTTGESASNLETGLSTAIRAMTASAAMRATDPDAMNQIHAMAVDPANDLSMPDREEGLISRVITGSTQASSADFIQSLLLGSRISNMADSLAGYAGVSKATARSLFGIATSMVLSYLGRMIRTERLNPTALSSRLAAERDSIVGGLPPALAKFYPSVPAAVSNVAAATPTAGVPASGTIAKQRSALSWALPATLAALVVWGVASFFGHSRAPEPARTVSVIAVPGAVGTGGFVRQELPSGKRLQLSPNGTEARLLAFMQRRGPVTKEDWFEFDRLNFETNSAMLTSDSKDQLSNVAEILKAYPRVSVKIGGYTDNTGDAAANLELSRKRAEAVRNQLEEMGIDAKRISAEGYGAQHPIANNDTAEGRMQNRRIAIRVTAK